MKQLILFLTGFCIYTTIETVFRGYSFILMGLAGGICMILLDKINDDISWDLDLAFQAMLGAELVTFVELVIGIAARLGYLPIMWDYSNVPFNFYGIICLPFSLAWMVLSAVGIFIADGINYYVFNQPDFQPYYTLFGKFHIVFPKRI